MAQIAARSSSRLRAPDSLIGLISTDFCEINTAVVPNCPRSEGQLVSENDEF